MPATDSERNRAMRIRKSIKYGESVSDANRAWLAMYESTHTGARTPRQSAPRIPPPTPIPSPIASAPPIPQAEPETPPNPPTEGWASISFGAPQQIPGAANHGPPISDGITCGVPDCPACRGNMGARKCAATGKLVWPPMSDLAARTVASALLGVVALIIRFIRRDKLMVIPTGDEVRDMANALRDIQRSHFTWIGAGHEFFALIGAVGSFGRRALTAKSQSASQTNSAAQTEADRAAE